MLDYLKGFSYVAIPTSFIFYVCLGIHLLNIRHSNNQIRKDRKNPTNKIKWLVDRCYSSVSEELSTMEEFNIQGVNSKFFTGSEKKEKKYPIADTKEIEYHLQEFLRLANDERDLEFIFVFDELDKLDPVVATTSLYGTLEDFDGKKEENVYQKQHRNRQQAIINIIAGLKNFFTTANARFIFIAGREMFDASLADIADRQSSISSIFTYIFYVESFLKEKDLPAHGENSTSQDTNNASLSNAIEEYLKTLFISKENQAKPGSLFDLVMQDSNLVIQGKDVGIGKNEQAKLQFIIQNFITYLVYRSNGSPQKLIKTVHEFTIIGEPKDKEKNIVFKRRNGKEIYLYFNYYNQYRIGFISYLFRPFLIQYGRSFKLFSDNIILSTPYLFDHLIKFHPFAFSLANLEMLPEVLSTTKTPALREHIREIVNYLGINHIRNTEIELFDYKFYSRTQNELKFISKVFEQEAAAFNFTLDESYLVKLHIRSKIKELRSIYSRFLGSSDQAHEQIYSIAHLNGILGDLSFFDQEYEDAIVAYSDAIRPIDNFERDKINARDFLSIIVNKLKLGLCYEKMHSFTMGLAFYADACADAKKFMINRLQPPDNGNNSESAILDNNIVNRAAMYDFLQIINQAFIAQLVIQQKMSIDGINIFKINESIGDFLSICKTATPETTHPHYLILANTKLLTGKLSFFRNGREDALNVKPIIKKQAGKSSIELHSSFFKLHNKFDRFLNIKPHNHIPLTALYFYIDGLCDVINSFQKGHYLLEKLIKKSSSTNIIYPILQFIEQTGQPGMKIDASGFQLRYIATFLSNIGDCLLSMHLVEKKLNPGNEQKSVYRLFEISEIFNPAGNTTINNLSDWLLPSLEEGKSSMSDILRCYYWSGKYFEKYGRTVSCSFQFRKILHVLRMIITNNNENADDTNREQSRKFGERLRTTIVIPLLEIASQNAGHSDRHMYKKALKSGMDESFAISNLSNHPEVREIIILYYYNCIKSGITVTSIDDLISSSNCLSTQYVRILELDLHARFLEKGTKFLFNGENKKDEDLKKAVNYLFSMLTILRTLKIYGTDYMLSFSFYAYTHFKIAEFLKYIEKVEKGNKGVLNNISKAMDELLGVGSYSSLDILYHYSRAREYYNKTIELHTGGEEYKKTLNRMNYLEDDLNDNAYHFGASVDRYMLINGVFDNKLETCKREISERTDKLNEPLFKNIALKEADQLPNY